MFLAELNGLLFQADVGNAYLEATTKEKVKFITDAGFGACEGHTLLVVKELNGVWTSGLCWHEHFADILWVMCLLPRLVLTLMSG